MERTVGAVYVFSIIASWSDVLLKSKGFLSAIYSDHQPLHAHPPRYPNQKCLIFCTTEYRWTFKKHWCRNCLQGQLRTWMKNRSWRAIQTSYVIVSGIFKNRLFSKILSDARQSYFRVLTIADLVSPHDYAKKMSINLLSVNKFTWPSWVKSTYYSYYLNSLTYHFESLFFLLHKHFDL